MKHVFKQGANVHGPTLLLLHGTGGTERDLLPLAEAIAPDASVLSVRGNVQENGMARFFRRLAEGVFDEEDLVFRTQELYEYLREAAVQYGFDRSQLIAVGYSNGANMAGSLMFHYKDALRGAILHHPMVPRRGIKLPALSGTPVWIGAGTNDPIGTPRETEELQRMLESAGASVEVHWERWGHQLVQTEIEAAAAWFELFERHFG